jgi:acetaldehyde dehydrogenase
MRVEKYDLEKIRKTAREIVEQIKQYVSGYDLVVEPYLNEANIVSAAVKVTGARYVLPEYAGNLDIINAAAVQTAKIHAQRFLSNDGEMTR